MFYNKKLKLKELPICISAFSPFALELRRVLQTLLSLDKTASKRTKTVENVGFKRLQKAQKGFKSLKSQQVAAKSKDCKIKEEAAKSQ